MYIFICLTVSSSTTTFASFFFCVFLCNQMLLPNVPLALLAFLTQILPFFFSYNFPMPFSNAFCNLANKSRAKMLIVQETWQGSSCLQRQRDNSSCRLPCQCLRRQEDLREDLVNHLTHCQETFQDSNLCTDHGRCALNTFIKRRTLAYFYSNASKRTFVQMQRSSVTKNK